MTIDDDAYRLLHDIVVAYAELSGRPVIPSLPAVTKGGATAFRLTFLDDGSHYSIALKRDTDAEMRRIAAEMNAELARGEDHHDWTRRMDVGRPSDWRGS